MNNINCDTDIGEKLNYIRSLMKKRMNLYKKIKRVKINGKCHRLYKCAINLISSEIKRELESIKLPYDVITLAILGDNLAIKSLKLGHADLYYYMKCQGEFEPDYKNVGYEYKWR